MRTLDGSVCELCGTDEVFRMRLWARACLGCGTSHTVCGACLSDWSLRLEDPDRALDPSTGD